MSNDSRHLCDKKRVHPFECARLIVCLSLDSSVMSQIFAPLSLNLTTFKTIYLASSPHVDERERVRDMSRGGKSGEMPNHHGLISIRQLTERVTEHMPGDRTYPKERVFFLFGRFREKKANVAPGTCGCSSVFGVRREPVHGFFDSLPCQSARGKCTCGTVDLCSQPHKTNASLRWTAKLTE